MEKKKNGLLFNFGLIFAVFTVITLAISGVTTYLSQMEAYQSECEQNIRNIGEYLEQLILADGSDFLWYQQYYMEHFDEIDIPYDFDEYQSALREFEVLFSEYHPGRNLGVDIQLEELDPEVQRAYFIYDHEYWLLTFEQARTAFHIPYTYYLVPKEEIYYMVYMIDGERTRRKDNDQLLYLGDEYYDDPAQYPVQWDAWFSGRKPEGYQVWDNEWGHTYAYYTPLIIDGTKLGLIGTEVEVSSVNQTILINTLKQLAGIALALALCMFIMLAVINHAYIEKIHRIESSISQYAATKDVTIANQLAQEATGADEISSLGSQAASMIHELDDHMKTLVETTRELSRTKREANAMQALANRDALTGIRNKTAYDNEIKRLEWRRQEGFSEFGIGMIDLNFLKRINDTYGHEQGNMAIRKLCRLTCTVFEHSPVFRIGGDEFAVILENRDYRNVDLLIQDFNDSLEEMAADVNLEIWERISASIGYAMYDETIDKSVDDVFRRADHAMYERKAEMKAIRTV
ncbi:MAG: GGDEF domain-containing protein [Lachnospiraceae bacterium]|nr:GGDEF domain-containing protein [Lachnospiraceae bacterium]